MRPAASGRWGRGRLGCLLAVLAAALPVAAPAGVAAESPPEPAAQAWTLVDMSDGAVLTSRDAEVARPIASTTKLMTARVARRELDLEDRVRAPAYAANPVESRIDLREGEEMTVRDLLYALLLESANDAAVALAVAAAGSVDRFVDEMNGEAGRLGLGETTYTNPIGLDAPGHLSSASDLAELGREVMADAVLGRVAGTESRTLRSGDRRRVVETRNTLLRRRDWVTGLKTGRTQEAGYVLVATGRRRGVDLIAVVLGARSERGRDRAAEELLDYGFSLYRRLEPVAAGARLAAVPVDYARRSLPLVAEERVRITVREGQRVEVRESAPDAVEGPIDRGEALGTAAVLVDGEERARVELVAAEDVAAPGALRKLREDAPLAPILIGLGTVACGVGVFLVRRRPRRP